MAKFHFNESEPTDIPPQIPDGYYLGTIEDLKEETFKGKDGERTRVRFTVKPHPTSGVKGSARIQLPYPENAEDWTNNEWQKIFQAALSKDAKAIAKLSGKDMTFDVLVAQLKGKPTYFSHRNEAREYQARDKEGNAQFDAQGNPVMRKAS